MNYFKPCHCRALLVGWSLLLWQVCFAADKDSPAKARSSSAKTMAAFSPEKLRPDSEVPLNPERYIWKLSTKRATLDKNANEVPIYMFEGDSNIRVAVGGVPVGEIITLDRIRMYGHRHFYRYAWDGGSQGLKKFGPSATFWIDGMNIDYAGKK